MNRQVFITAIILTVFAVIGGGLVAFTEKSTAAQISNNEKLALQQSLSNLLPPNCYDNDLTESVISVNKDKLLGTKKSSNVYVASLDTVPVAFIFNSIAPRGYNGGIYLLIGVYADGEIAGVRVHKHKETPGLGDAIDERRSDWIYSFNSKSLDNLSSKEWKVKRDGGYFDQFTGATITPRAVVKAVHDTLLYFKEHKETLLQQANSLTPESNKGGK